MTIPKSGGFIKYRYRFTCGWNHEDGEEASFEVRTFSKIHDIKRSVKELAGAIMPLDGDFCRVDDYFGGHVKANFYGDQPDGYDGPYAVAYLWTLPDVS